VNPVKAKPPAPEVAKLLVAHDRETYDLRLEIADLRHELEALKAKSKVWREGGQMAVTMVSRYRRAVRSIGWTPPDDESELLEKIRRELET
jgi:hypothetical protein